MTEYRRKSEIFALCGLNCCLCPRYHTDGTSRCPGCGGPEFSSKHPSCAVVGCSKKHGNVEYCFECAEYPCKKYVEPSPTDSFISYKNVQRNMEDASADLKIYLKDLKKKREYLMKLLQAYNDGKMKNFYCIAVNLLPLPELASLMRHIETETGRGQAEPKERAKEIAALFRKKAEELGIELVLRK